MKKIIMLTFLLLLTGCTVPNEVNEHSIQESQTTNFVEIRGEVSSPGVYEMNQNDRIIHLIEKSGGLTTLANTKSLNKSIKLYDEMIITICSINDDDCSYNIDEHTTLSTDNTSTENNKVIVEIRGEVQNEGVYELTENSRIIDAIKSAGGFKENVDLSTINLALKLKDEMLILVCNENDDDCIETAKIINYLYSGTNNQTTDNNTGNNQTGELVNINTANKSLLETLPNIGSSTATKIIEHRILHGAFLSIEDILNVSGIGEATYEQIKNFITI